MKHAQLNATKLQLGEILTARGVITTHQLKEALQEQASQGRRRLLGEILVDLNFATAQQVMEALAECYGVPYVKVTPKVADPRVTEELSPEFLSNHCILPLFLVRGVLTVAVSEPANLFLVEEIERLTGHDVQIVASTASDIRATLQSHVPSANVFVIDDIYRDVELRDFSVVDAQVSDISNLEEISGKSPVIKLVNYIVYQAVQDRASDVHIEPDDHECRVRYRIDGRLVTRLNPPHQMHPAVVSRIKIMSGLDISERRMPQDGDIHVMLDGRPIDLRVSTMPGKWGEKVVIRIIDNRSAIVPLERIGFAQEVLDEWKQIISAPNGIILVTGPTGSGKSTTLYSVLSEVATDELNISTVENPVEVNIPGINQFQINERSGFTFASALRAMLRQDPDIVMVGEIRDTETATIATQAALTGHVVYSTLHTNDSISAVTRLVNMGIESYLVAAMLRGVLAQRLVRKICPHCKEEHEPDERLQAVLHDTIGRVGTLYQGAGCSRCHGKGYAGRLGIFELFSPPDSMLEAISEGLGLHELRAIAQRLGFRSLRHDGLEKSLAGLTTVDEVLRVCSL
ncbi:MAG: GspE/PulE family protein [Planctomycetota bacterium]|jgi:type IV pilus assembly protein PilB